jgi:hypothetical protein
MSPTYTADLKDAPDRNYMGGGKLYLQPYDATKEPFLPYCTLKTDVTSGAGKTLTAWYANGGTGARDFVAGAGALDIDIFGANAESNKAYTGLSANAFAGVTLVSDHLADAVLRKYNANAYLPANYRCLGRLDAEGSDFDASKSVVEVTDEEGELVASHGGKRAATLTCNLLQLSDEEIDFLDNEVDGMEHHGIYVMDGGTKGHQFLVIRRCVIIPGVKWKSGAETPRKTPVVIKILKDGQNRLFKTFTG